jgi:hypothetical protein
MPSALFLRDKGFRALHVTHLRPQVNTGSHAFAVSVASVEDMQRLINSAQDALSKSICFISEEAWRQDRTRALAGERSS